MLPDICPLLCWSDRAGSVGRADNIGVSASCKLPVLYRRVPLSIGLAATAVCGVCGH